MCSPRCESLATERVFNHEDSTVHPSVLSGGETRHMYIDFTATPIALGGDVHITETQLTLVRLPPS
jgi:hypothetical protein